MSKILIILTLFFAFVIQADAQTAKFAGTYQFSEDGGQTAGGTAVYVSHELKITADGTATLTASGYQTSKSIIAKAKSVGAKLHVYFEKYDEDGSNMFTPLKGGELLLTIEYRAVKGKRTLWTTFANYDPVVFEAKKNGGVYFKKSE